MACSQLGQHSECGVLCVAAVPVALCWLGKIRPVGALLRVSRCCGSACLQLRPQRTVTHPMCAACWGVGQTLSLGTDLGTEAERLCLQPQGPVRWELRPSGLYLLKLLNIFEQEFSNFHFSLSPANCVAGGGWTGPALPGWESHSWSFSRGPAHHPEPCPALSALSTVVPGGGHGEKAQVSCHRRGAGARRAWD